MYVHYIACDSACSAVQFDVLLYDSYCISLSCASHDNSSLVRRIIADAIVRRCQTALASYV
eukprot:6182621-Pleurochrysis_carterae.AAC.1